MSEGKHPNYMTREELRELVGDMSSLALDLAQHLHFTIHCLRDEYKEDAYNKACQMAYDIAYGCFDGFSRMKRGNAEIAVFGAGGLEVVRGNIEDMVPPPTEEKE